MFYTISVLIIIVIFFIDLIFSIKLGKTSTKQNIIWVCLCVLLSVIFFALLFYFKSSTHAINFMTGYLAELTLSIDNIFVFYIIIEKYKIPEQFKREVLTFGIIIAFISRVIFILLGIELINRFEFFSYILAILLFYTGINIMFSHNKEVKEGQIMKYFKKHFNYTNKFTKKGTLRMKINGKKYLTPIFFAIIFIGSVDIMFSIDSIPTAFGITKNIFIVIMINFFALFGLRQMYFLFEKVVTKIKSLHYGLSVILIFIGSKILIEALNQNHLSFINSGKPLNLFHISPINTLLVIVLCLLLCVLIDLIKKDKTKKII